MSPRMSWVPLLLIGEWHHFLARPNDLGLDWEADETLVKASYRFLRVTESDEHCTYAVTILSRLHSLLAKPLAIWSDI